MSYVITAPDMLAAAAADTAGIGSSLSEANTAATAPTTAVVAAAGDEVSAAIASLFSSHGTAFQALSAQAATFHSRGHRRAVLVPTSQPRSLAPRQAPDGAGPPYALNTTATIDGGCAETYEHAV